MLVNSNPMKLIDCDIHVYPRNSDEIKRYLEQPWKQRFSIRENAYYKNPNPRLDRKSPTGGRSGSDPKVLREQWIDASGIYRAILFTQGNITANHDPDYSNAVATAYNT